MSFSEDFGFAPVKKIQIAEIDTTTRNRLFNTFTQADYDKVYGDLKAGKYTIFNDVSENDPAKALTNLSNTKVTFIE